MNQLSTPKGLRLHIGVFGRRNVGKSSTLNALTRQNLSIVSEVAGTTTDPVEKAIELLPIGPVVFIDAAGIDDFGALGEERVAKTRQTFERVDLALIVVDATRDDAWGEFEESLVDEMNARSTPVLVVVNKIDAVGRERVDAICSYLESRNLTAVPFSALLDANAKVGAPKLRDALTKLVPDEFLTPPPVVSDLVAPGDFVLLVTPIDKEAPKGRLILPQVQTIRDLLDGDLGCVVVKENLLGEALAKYKPALVVTDSQAFKTVAATTPKDVPLTSFSILFARQKGNLTVMLAGARAIDALTEKSRVLIAEACAHHPIEEDIGTVKIPRALRKKVGEALTVDHVQGHDFPDVDALGQYDLIIHCGACMFNRRETASRINRALEAGMPITNYGLALAALNGILDRAVAPLTTPNRKNEGRR